MGYWYDELTAPDWPMPHQYVEPGWCTGEREDIVRYLRSGAVWRSFLGFSYCRFDRSTPPSEMGNKTLTDGVWAWPEGLWVYVKRYDVRLPSEFVEHMRRNGFVVPPVDVEPLLARGLDLSFWRHWTSEGSEALE